MSSVFVMQFKGSDPAVVHAHYFFISYKGNCYHKLDLSWVRYLHATNIHTIVLLFNCYKKQHDTDNMFK